MHFWASSYTAFFNMQTLIHAVYLTGFNFKSWHHCQLSTSSFARMLTCMRPEGIGYKTDCRFPDLMGGVEAQHTVPLSPLLCVLALFKMKPLSSHGST